MKNFLYKVRHHKQRKKKNSKTPALGGNPQKKGVCLKVYITTPKKPNSARRKVTRIRLTNKRRPIVYIPGEGHNLQQYSWVLIRGGRVKDLPGIRYKIIRNKYDMLPLDKRTQRRSKYGVKRWQMRVNPRKTIYKYK